MNEVSLSYLLWHLGSVGVRLGAPAFLVLLAAVPLIGRSARTRTERIAAGLRAAALTLLALGLAGLALSVSLPATRMTLIAAVDMSQSIDRDGRDWSLRLLNAVAGALAPGDELGIVTFAGGARVARAPAPAAPITSLPEPPKSNATDIAQGIDTALALLPPDSAHRVLLITDGNETRGRARGKLAAALRAQAAIFTAAPPHTGVVDVSVEKMVAPPLVAEGSIFPIRIVARNSHGERPAKLTLSLDGETLGSEAVTLQQGLNVMEVPYRLDATGSHRLRAEVAVAGDGLPGNNYRDATVMVAGPPRVLLLTSSRPSPLANALESKDVGVDVKPASDLPRDAQALLAYHCIVVEDAVAKDLDEAQLAALERYVRDFGGGLLFAGGAQSFGDPGFRQTPLARMLPVTLEPRRAPPRERDPLALMILIDRSNSMGYAARPLPGSNCPARPGHLQAPLRQGRRAGRHRPAEGSRPRRRHRLRLGRLADRAAQALVGEPRTAGVAHPASSGERRHRLLRRPRLGQHAALRIARDAPRTSSCSPTATPTAAPPTTTR